MSPLNGVEGDFYNCIGSSTRQAHCVHNPVKIVTNSVTFKILIEENGIITAARWRIFGDPIAIATASWCVEKILGRTASELVHIVTPERAALELDIAEEVDIRSGCLAVVEALANALNNYISCSIAPQNVSP